MLDTNKSGFQRSNSKRIWIIIREELKVGKKAFTRIKKFSVGKDKVVLLSSVICHDPYLYKIKTTAFTSQ